jgi:flagellar assembly factor FliW
MITEQTLQSSRFGNIEVPEALIVEFPEGLMGMHHLKRFVMVEPSAAASPFRFLLSLDDHEVGFGIADPTKLFANYEVDFAAEREVLDIEADEEAKLYVMLTIGENPMRTTADLLAPILLNTRTMVGRQLVLSDSRYSTKHPIIAARQQ